MNTLLIVMAVVNGVLYFTDGNLGSLVIASMLFLLARINDLENNLRR